jgi:DNA-binding MarR family transcriptional regulator
MGVLGEFHGENYTGNLYSFRMTDFSLEHADRLRRAIGDIVRSVQETEHTPGGQIETLGFLVRDGAQSIAQLARRRRIRHQSMSGTVAELEARGWVTRSPDPADRRSVVVTATDEGTAAIEESRSSRAGALLRAAEEALTAEERALLARVPELLDKLGGVIAAR